MGTKAAARLSTTPLPDPTSPTRSSQTLAASPADKAHSSSLMRSSATTLAASQSPSRDGKGKRKAMAKPSNSPAAKRKRASITPVSTLDDSDEEEPVLSLWKLHTDSEALRSTLGAEAGSQTDGKKVAEPKQPVKAFVPNKLPLGVRADSNDGSSCYVLRKGNLWVARLVAYHPATSAEDSKRRGDQYEVQEYGKPQPQKVKRPMVVFKKDEVIAKHRIGAIERRVADQASWNARHDRAPDDAPFEDKSRCQQLEAIEDRLLALLRGEYEPAARRLELFFSPKLADRKALQAENDRGDIFEKEIDEDLIPALRRWVSTGVFDPKDTAAATRQKPLGDDRFDALSGLERERFINDVLLPEAIIQICIKSMEIDEPTEQSTYDSAREELQRLAQTTELRWEERSREMKLARDAMREQLDMSPEKETGEEKTAKLLARPDMKQSYYSGRAIKFNAARMSKFS